MKNARTPLFIAGILAVGFWLGNLFQGFGPGGPGNSVKTGTGDGSPAEQRDPNAARTELASQRAAVPTIAGEGSETSAPIVTSPPDRTVPVTILIDGAGYAIVDPEGGTTATSLSAAIDRAAVVSGDDQGVRVRIIRRQNAQAGAKADLLSALEKAGVASEAIQEKSGFVD